MKRWAMVKKSGVVAAEGARVVIKRPVLIKITCDQMKMSLGSKKNHLIFYSDAVGWNLSGKWF